ncbi:AAA family ATPase [Aquisphaera insulae]|uniref:AAA family ATPase n=1 Tax=Aquisphaera insulae TaxID=2712864 RepID=UPI0013EAD51F|nr:AAA family ATPase [Aquisphaera insulae]
MLTKLSIERFRGLRKLEIESLDRINLFLGRNNVGKSAILEALFLLAGPTNPELPLRLSALRGIEQIRFDPDEMWGWLFYERKIDSSIILKNIVDGSKRCQLTISLKERSGISGQAEKKRPVFGGQVAFSATSASLGPAELTLAYQEGSQKPAVSRAFFKEDGIGFERAKGYTFPNSVFLIARGGYAPENSERFSRLAEVDDEDSVIEPLKVLEPRLKRLAVLVTAGGPMIHGDIGIGRMVPVPLMGEGIGRLITILLAISFCEGGLVLVDEIESGFHYSVMPRVWSAIAKAARDNDVQIFATTHSFECLRAGHEAMADSGAADFGIHRLDRIDGEVEAVQFDDDMIQTALSAGLELR